MKILRVFCAFATCWLTLVTTFAQSTNFIQQEIPDIELIIGIDFIDIKELSLNLTSVSNTVNFTNHVIRSEQNTRIVNDMEEEEKEEEVIETELIMIRAQDQELNEKRRTINLYPNPASSTVNFEVNDEQYKDVKIYNMIGNLMSSHQIENSFGVNLLNISNLSEGMYLLHFTGKENAITSMLMVR